MTARQKVEAIEQSMLAALRQLPADMPLAEALASGAVRAGAANAVQHIVIEEDHGVEG